MFKKHSKKIKKRTMFFKKRSEKIKKRSTFFKKKAQLFSEAPYTMEDICKSCRFFSV